MAVKVPLRALAIRFVIIRFHDTIRFEDVRVEWGEMEWMRRWEDVERKGKFERTEGKCETTRRRDGEHEARQGKREDG